MDKSRTFMTKSADNSGPECCSPKHILDLVYRLFIIVHFAVFFAAISLAISMNVQDRFTMVNTSQAFRRTAIAAVYLLPVFLLIPAIIAVVGSKWQKFSVVRCLCDTTLADASHNFWGFWCLSMKVMRFQEVSTGRDDMESGDGPSFNNTSLYSIWNNKSFTTFILLEIILFLSFFPVLCVYGVDEFWGADVVVSGRSSRMFTTLFFLSGVMPLVSVFGLWALNGPCCK